MKSADKKFNQWPTSRVRLCVNPLQPLSTRENDLDIIGIAESWLGDNIANSEISIENYTVYRKDRCRVKEGRGGGVLLYVRNSLLATECHELNKWENESVWCQIIVDKLQKVLVGVVYRSPNLGSS